MAKPDYRETARKVAAELREASMGPGPHGHLNVAAVTDFLVEAFQGADDEWREHWTQAIRERDSARQEVEAAHSVDFWAWQEDGNDLESMGEGMVVQMTAGNLRAMLKAAEEKGQRRESHVCDWIKGRTHWTCWCGAKEAGKTRP